MPPRRFSRHTFTLGIKDPEKIELTDRQPYGYRQLADNRQHIVKQGETLYSLAARYFKPLERPAGLWWVIGDFQPEPIHDPTLTLVEGTMLYVPSVRTVTEYIFSERRRLESVL